MGNNMRIVLISPLRLYISFVLLRKVSTFWSWVFWYWNYTQKASFFDKERHCIGFRLFGFSIERF